MSSKVASYSYINLLKGERGNKGEALEGGIGLL